MVVQSHDVATYTTPFMGPIPPLYKSYLDPQTHSGAQFHFNSTWFTAVLWELCCRNMSGCLELGAWGISLNGIELRRLLSSHAAGTYVICLELGWQLSRSHTELDMLPHINNTWICFICLALCWLFHSRAAGIYVTCLELGRLISCYTARIGLICLLVGRLLYSCAVGIGLIC